MPFTDATASLLTPSQSAIMRIKRHARNVEVASEVRGGVGNEEDLVEVSPSSISCSCCMYIRTFVLTWVHRCWTRAPSPKYCCNADWVGAPSEDMWVTTPAAISMSTDVSLENPATCTGLKEERSGCVQRIVMFRLRAVGRS